MSTQRTTITQVTLFTAITLLAIAAIAYQLGQASYKAGARFRNLINRLDGSGGPTCWLQLAFNRLRPEFYLAPYSPFNSYGVNPTSQGLANAVEPLPAKDSSDSEGHLTNAQSDRKKPVNHKAPSSFASLEAIAAMDGYITLSGQHSELTCLIDLSKFTSAQLRQLARHHQVKRYGNLTKAQLVLALS